MQRQQLATSVPEVSAPAAAGSNRADEPPPPPNAAPPKKKVPDTLPDITLADRDGKPTQARELRRPAADGEFLGDLVCALPPRDPAAQ